MADYVVAKSGVAWIGYIALVSQADTKLLQSSPTLAAGDFKVSIDGGATANLATLPTNTPGGVFVKVSLSAAEMTGDNIAVACIDAAGAQWCDQFINIQTGVRGLADLAYPATSGRAILVNSDTTVQADVRELLGTAWLTPVVAGTPDVNTKLINNIATTSVTAVNAIQGLATAIEATGGVHSPVIRGGTAQSGSSTTTIKLDSGASAVNDFYKGMVVRVISGTGAAQPAKVISSYVGSTKVATVSGTWVTTPDNTSVFVVLDYALGAIWDEVITSALHNVLNSSALLLRNASGGGAIAIRTGTAQTGSSSTTIKLDSGASATNNIYNNMTVVITGGTGLGQTRTIIAYVGSTKVATVAGAWVTTPDNTSTFALYAAPTSLVSDQGVAQAGAASTLTLAATASATSSIYNGSFLTITGGTDSGDTAVITAYNGSTKVATVSPAWSVTPDSTSTYAVIPAGNVAADSAPTPPTAAQNAAALLGSTLTQRDVSALTTNTVEDALSSSRAQGAGAWVLTGTTLTLKNPDGTTFRSFTLDSASSPTSRT